MTEPILVSVIIPTYKRDVRVLTRAVKSVRDQTWPNIEIIVVDDSPRSFPGREAVRAYMEGIADERTFYLQNTRHLGGSLARNRGVSVAHGEYISFLDDDDAYFPDKIEKQLAFTRAGGYDLTLTSMVMHNEKEKVVDYREHDDISGMDQETLLHYHLMKHLTGTPSFMFRKASFDALGGFEDARMGQEFYLMLKCIEGGLKIGYLPECTVKVYKHAEGGITQGRNKIDGENALYARKKQYFSRLNAREIRYINFRHWAVMVVAYRRNRMPAQMLLAGLRALISSPGDFFAEVFGFVRRIFRNRKL